MCGTVLSRDTLRRSAQRICFKREVKEEHIEIETAITALTDYRDETA